MIFNFIRISLSEFNLWAQEHASARTSRRDEENHPPSQLRWRRLAAVLALPIILTGLIATGLVCFGNPQWQRRIYLVQAYLLPGKVKRPAKYTGVWRDWNRAGQLTSQVRYEAGHPREFATWNAAGAELTRGWYTRSGERFETRRIYHPNGTCAAKFRYQGKCRNGSATWWNSNGVVLAQGVYKNARCWQGRFLVQNEIGAKQIVERYADGDLLTQTIIDPNSQLLEAKLTAPKTPRLKLPAANFPEPELSER